MKSPWRDAFAFSGVVSAAVALIVGVIFFPAWLGFAGLPLSFLWMVLMSRVIFWIFDWGGA